MTIFRLLLALVLLLIVLPPLVSIGWYLIHAPPNQGWHNASREPTGLAPDPAGHREALVQVYAAPTFSWRGALGLHPWVAVKEANAAEYERFEVIGWRGRDVVRSTVTTHPDREWYGTPPLILAEIAGTRAEAAIPEIRQAAASYPYLDEYRVWPGPNSNTFMAWIGRHVPELRLDLPANAIGKDYVPGLQLVRAPSGTGWQLSAWGVLGVLLAREEGLEINVLGLSAGIDLTPPAIRVPGFGRIGWPARNQPSD